MIIAVAGGKGSPGATALAALIASTWPHVDQPRVLMEADPEGGVLAARWHHSLGVTHDPGLLSLAAARDGSALERVRQHGQPVRDGLELVAGPPGGAQAEACLRELGDGAAEALRDAPVVCIVDCGRLHPTSSALPLARAAEHLLLVTRPRLDEVVGLAPAAERLLVAGLTPTLVCIGTAPFAPAEVAEHVALPLRAVIADDPVALATLFAQGPAARRVVRSRLRKSVTALVATLTPASEAAAGVAADQAGNDRVRVR